MIATRRTLPERDEEIAALDPETRALLAKLWTERARSELNAGSGFAIVVTELYALGADTRVIELAARAAHDEVKHSALCLELASAYAGAPIAAPRPKRVGMPPHRGASDTLRMHLHVVGLACINETIAAGFIDECVREAHAPLVRAIHLEHFADEIAHGRVGWAHLASEVVDDSVRAGIAAWLPRLVRANRTLWHARIAELPERGVARHAYPPRATLDAAVDRAIAEVVLPGFAHVGVRVQH